MIKSIVKIFNVEKSEKGTNKKHGKTISDYQKDVMRVVSELDLAKKVTQKSTQELKDIALELLYLGSLEIRDIARTLSINSFSKGFSKHLITKLSDGMHNLSNLIANVENDKIKHSYYTKESLESEIITCISALIMNLIIQRELSSIGHLDNFFSKHFEYKSIVIDALRSQ